MTLVHEVIRYLEIVERAELDPCDPKFKPMYYSKDFNKLERKLDKYLTRSGWYDTDDKVKSSWKSRLPVTWRGSKPAQRKVPELKFTTVMHVPSSVNSRLLKVLARVEPRVAKTCGYQAMLVEKGGRQLFKFFSKDLGNVKCSRLDCIPCKNVNVKGTSMCKTKSVVYESMCNICDVQYK